MVALGRTTRAGFVWLTALLTLVAGLPHVQCRCPSGRIKVFCPGDATGGCCATAASCSPPEACCAPTHAAPVREDVRSCCCHASAPATEIASETGVAAMRCTKTLPAAAVPLEDPRQPSWQGHSLAPPPTDLVTVLQRLTI
jgi:hypothetical protein